MILSEKNLVRISIAGIFIGLASLYIVSQNMQSEALPIASLKPGMAGKYVDVTGNISKIQKLENGLILTMQDNTTQVKVVLWNSLLEELKLKGFELDKIQEGIKIDVVGIVEVYRGSLEIIPTKSQDIKIIV